MNDVPHIPREIDLRESKDFSFLRERGIELVQQLAGDIWTDYNEHDPGVTILEQLCYALTDLGYRTDYHIQDILAPSPFETEPLSDTFYTGNRILPTRPISRVDYRKLLYDRLKGIRNIWLRKAEGPQVEGLYDVLIDLFDAYDFDDGRKRVLRDTWGTLIAFRNLTEDFHKVEILKKAHVTVTATVVVGPYPTPESILADILYGINKTLSPYPALTPIDQLFDKEIPPDEIYNGPLMSLGIIDDDTLTPIPTEIRYNQITGAIRRVEGVRTIKDCTVRVRYDDEDQVNVMQYNDHQVLLREGTIPSLTPNIFNQLPEGATYTIELLRDGEPYRIDPNNPDRMERVWRKVREKQENLLNEYIFARRTMADADYRQVPPGTYKDLSTYFSIQNQFPLTYGIGAYGIPNQLYYPVKAGNKTLKLSPYEMKHERLMRARQLKAYLLFFEQILINYQAQLAHVRDLFSLNKTQNRTYFTQSLFTVPNVAPVLPDRSMIVNLQARLADKKVATPIAIQPEYDPVRNPFARRIIILSDDEPRLGYLEAVASKDENAYVKLKDDKTHYPVNDATEVTYSYKGALTQKPAVLDKGMFVRVVQVLGRRGHPGGQAHYCARR